METFDLLLTMAEVAVGLAGFSAIIVTLNRRPIREWDDTDQLNLRLLIQVSGLTIFFSLLPLLLQIPLSIPDTWLYGLLIYGLIHIIDVSFFLMNVTPETPPVFRNSARTGFCVAVIQLIVFGVGTTVWQEAVYVFTLFWHLGIVFLAFILLLYQIRHAPKSNSSDQS